MWADDCGEPLYAQRLLVWHPAVLHQSLSTVVMSHGVPIAKSHVDLIRLHLVPCRSAWSRYFIPWNLKDENNLGSSYFSSA